MLNRRQFIAFGTAAAAASGTYAADDAVCDTAADVVDVLVVGAGAAGLAAARSAHECGASVLVLEAAAEPGGNTNRSAGFMNAVAAGAENDSASRHAAETLWSGEQRGQLELISTLTSNAGETARWLAEAGVRFQKELSQPYGGISCRAVRPTCGSGRGYIEALLANLRRAGVSILTSTRAVGIERLHREGLCCRVLVEDDAGRTRTITVRRGLVAANGGFSADKRLCALYEPRLAELAHMGAPELTGRFTQALFSVGAETTGMDYIGLGPASLTTGRFVGGACSVGRVIFVNKKGERFYPEDGLCDLLAEAVLQSPGQVMFSIFDEDAFEALLEDERRTLDEAQRAGDAITAPTLSELANLAGLPANAVELAVRTFNQAVEENRDPIGRSSKTLRHKVARAPFHLVRLKMAVQLTQGGLWIDERARMLDRNGNVIPGFFAAGEAAGGIHGTNRLEGNALAAAFTFGRIAGREAARTTPGFCGPCAGRRPHPPSSAAAAT